MFRNLCINFVTHIFKIYIDFVYLTSKIELKNIDKEDLGNRIVGFWHGDSFAMNLVIKEFLNKGVQIYPLVTEDLRGDFISKTIEKFGAKSIRVVNGFGIRETMKSILQICDSNNTNIVIAMDGPLGPYHIPKTLGFKLSKITNKPFVLITVEYSNKITLSKRWDKYKIPLPFTKIKFNVTDYGVISNEFISMIKINRQVFCNL